MSYGFRLYRRDTINAGPTQTATYSQLSAGSGYQWARQARDAAAAAREAAFNSYDSPGPDASGFVFQVFEE
jgi:hypothetical protein